MRVTRIAQTEVIASAMAEATDDQFDPYDDLSASDMDLLAEFAGRACYQSWSRPNLKTAKNADYIRSTVHEKAHESITAHASVTYYITGISRALTHELIRHRFLAFSELSQRYVDMYSAQYVTPPALEAEEAENHALWNQVELSTGIYREVVGYLKETKGFSTKQAREAARVFLPNAMETRIVVSGNLRAWRDFLKQRWSVHADAEIRNLAGEILKDLRKVAPATFADIPEEPYE